jgi:hypothetical protein
LGNYTITYNTANFTITPKTASVTPNAASKVYGSPDPALTGTLTGFLSADNVTATYSRTPGEMVAGSPYTISATLSPAGVLGNYTITYNTANFTINKAGLTVTADNKSRQYSDPDPAFTFTITGFKNGDTVAVVSGNPSCSTTATSSSGPGDYPITCAQNTLSAANYSFTFVAGVLTITQEDARIYYTGASLFWTASTSSTTVDVTLTATVKDITALGSLSADPAYDPYAGDIRKANVTIYVNGSPICTVAPSLVSASDIKVGTVTCVAKQLSTGNTGATQYSISFKVDGYYRNDLADLPQIITVAQPITTNFITGGGYLVTSNAAGQYAGSVNSRANFGFNVKYNKGGTNLQGNISIIFRRNGRFYLIKSNSLTSLVVSACVKATTTTPCTANVVSKATLTDITNPFMPVSIGGNLTFQMTLSDRGEPGSSDSISFTLWNGSTLYYSSNWNGTKTVEQTLNGGNLVVH